MNNSKALRILGLDDDNHSPVFVCEEGTEFNTYKELVEFLCKPHDCEIEVKMFAIVDQPSKELAKHDMEDIDDMFYFLEGVGSMKQYDFQKTFDLFWESANKEWW